MDRKDRAPDLASLDESHWVTTPSGIILGYAVNPFRSTSSVTLTPARERALAAHPARRGNVPQDKPQLRLIQGGGLSGGNTRRNAGSRRRERRWLRLVTG